MAIQGIMFCARSVVGHALKSSLCTRFFVPFYQQTAGVSVESKLGLPEKPKRPLGAFMTYLEMRRPDVRAENPHLHMKEITKKMTLEWKTCDPALKKKLTEEAIIRTKSYVKLLQEYNSALSEEDLEAIRAARAQKRKEKLARLVKKKQKILQKPKRPDTAYVLFLKDNLYIPELKDTPIAEKFKIMGEMWRKAPEEVVIEYRKKAVSLYRQYQVDLAAWEEKVVAEGKLGVFDLPRKTKKP